MVANSMSEIDDYKRMITELIPKIVSKANDLKIQAIEYQPKVVDFATNFANSALAEISDLAPIKFGMNGTIFETYIGVALYLFVASIGYLLGTTVLWLVFGLLYDSVYAAIFALVILPVFVSHSVSKIEMSKDERNMVLLLYTVLSSAIVGTVLHSRYSTVSPSPPMFLFPLALAVVFAFVAHLLADQPRHLSVGIGLGAAVFLALILGLVFGSFGVKYLIWSIVLGGVAFADFQFKIGRSFEGLGLQSGQVLTIAIYQMIGLFLSLAFSSSEPPPPPNHAA